MPDRIVYMKEMRDILKKALKFQDELGENSHIDGFLIYKFVFWLDPYASDNERRRINRVIDRCLSEEYKFFEPGEGPFIVTSSRANTVSEIRVSDKGHRLATENLYYWNYFLKEVTHVSGPVLGVLTAVLTYLLIELVKFFVSLKGS